jgi:hypothetical protein
VTRLPVCKNSLRVTFALTVGLQGSWSSYAIAGEKHAELLLFQHFSAEAGELSPSEFDRRWTDGQQYRLFSSGPILPPGSPAASNRRVADPYGIDADASSAISDPRTLIEVEGVKQIGNESDRRAVVETAIAPAECGPSPLGADDIHALVVETAQRHGVDQHLALAVASAESDLDQNRISAKGARVPMQLTPATAARFGVADPCEPAANIDAGVRYLALLLDEFRNPILAIAAYKAGEDRVYEYGGIPPFPEIVNYVARVVSLQVGQQMHRRRPSKAPRGEGSGESTERGVVVTGKRRQWVAGVMQF